MKSCSVDTMAKSLSTLAANSQKRMDDERSRLSATINIDAEGQPQYVNWECRVPSGDGKQRQHSLLKIPWESFYADDPMSVTEVSLEFECTIKKKTAEDSADHYILKPINKSTRDSENGRAEKSGHVFKLSLNAENDFSSEALLDDQLLEEYLDQNEHATGGKNTVQKFIHKYINQIINLFKRII